MASTSIASEPSRNGAAESTSNRSRRQLSKGPAQNAQPNWFIRTFRSLFGYRKTSLTVLVFASLLFSVILSVYDNSLEWTVPLPTDKFENSILDYSWASLQKIGASEHTYTSRNNDRVHDFLEDELIQLVSQKKYMEYDNDLNYTNNILYPVKYLSYNSVSYYESNNLLVRINGSDESLPALLLSAHYDSVPSSFGITDDGMGVASMIGLVKYFASKKTAQPKRTIIFNFNNNEEFGLYGATAFLSHPWFSSIKYFLNLEGTGAGGKAVLFRGTDYGIVKHFSSVRYPYATSLFQQGFDNGLIHSETDYSVYKTKGNIRGLDLAFYKPRDLYHTGGDNIKNINIKALWHMLSNALDFTNHIVEGAIDLDDESVNTDLINKDSDFAGYTSFLNFFFSASVSAIFLINIVVLVFLPVLSLLLLIAIFNYKKDWSINFTNAVKFPLSFALSTSLLSFATDVLIIPSNAFLPNNSTGTLVATMFAAFLLLNYIFLNSLNALFKPFKGHHHDEKLIVLLESSLISWVALVYSTVKLSKNKIGDDHTGEFYLTIVFCLQSLACIIGLLSWCFKRTPKRAQNIRAQSQGDSQPLLSHNAHEEYGAHENGSLSDSSSLMSDNCDDEQVACHKKKSWSYDWLLQFLIAVPIASFVVYNAGFLVLSGFNKSIQESLQAQEVLYFFLKAFVTVWALIYMPFIFKLNRIMVLVLVIVLIQGIFTIALKPAFDISNPLKLRFLETIDLDSSPPSNMVTVSARSMPLVEQILQDMPSFKESGSVLQTEDLGDGVSLYSWNSSLSPHLVTGLGKATRFLDIEVLKDSTSAPAGSFGMLTGEIKVFVPKNRNCKVTFSVAKSSVKILGQESSAEPRSSVRSVTIFQDAQVNGTAGYTVSGDVEQASKDSNGNLVYKDSDGIKQVQLNKLSWDKPYHLGFQWVPEIAELSEGAQQKVDVKKLGVEVECYWSDLNYVAGDKEDGFEEQSTIPAYDELIHYSPNYVSIANRDRGLLSVKKYIEV